MKKVAAIVLSAIVGLSLAACGNSNNQASGGESTGSGSTGTNIVDTTANSQSEETHLIFSWWGNQTTPVWKWPGRM